MVTREEINQEFYFNKRLEDLQQIINVKISQIIDKLIINIDNALYGLRESEYVSIPYCEYKEDGLNYLQLDIGVDNYFKNLTEKDAKELSGVVYTLYVNSFEAQVYNLLTKYMDVGFDIYLKSEYGNSTELRYHLYFYISKHKVGVFYTTHEKIVMELFDMYFTSPYWYKNQEQQTINNVNQNTISLPAKKDNPLVIFWSKLLKYALK